MRMYFGGWDGVSTVLYCAVPAVSSGGQICSVGFVGGEFVSLQHCSIGHVMWDTYRYRSYCNTSTLLYCTATGQLARPTLQWARRLALPVIQTDQMTAAALAVQLHAAGEQFSCRSAVGVKISLFFSKDLVTVLFTAVVSAIVEQKLQTGQ